MFRHLYRQCRPQSRAGCSLFASRLEHDVLVVNGFTQEGLSKRSRLGEKTARDVGSGMLFGFRDVVFE